MYNSLDALIRRLRDIRDERTNLVLVSEGWAPEGERADLAQFPDLGLPPIPTIGVSRGGKIMRGNPQTGNPDQAGCRRDVGASCAMPTSSSDSATSSVGRTCERHVLSG